MEKNRSFFILTIILFHLSACYCASVECESQGGFFFKLIDKNSKQDLVYDVMVPLTDFVLTVQATGEIVTIEKNESSQSLAISFDPSNTAFNLDYQGQRLPFSIQVNTFKSDCCLEYRVTGVSTPSGAQYGDEPKIFLIEI